MPILVDGLTSEEALILGQRLRRPERVSVATWKGFWKGYERRNIKVVRSAAEPFDGLVVARPHLIEVADWFDFWQRRALNDMRIHT